jgi:hypothetical protein
VVPQIRSWARLSPKIIAVPDTTHRPTTEATLLFVFRLSFSVLYPPTFLRFRWTGLVLFAATSAALLSCNLPQTTCRLQTPGLCAVSISNAVRVLRRPSQSSVPTATDWPLPLRLSPILSYPSSPCRLLGVVRPGAVAASWTNPAAVVLENGTLMTSPSR